MAKRDRRWAELRVVLLATLLFVVAGAATCGAAQNSPGFKEFSDGVQRYVKLHKDAESALGPLKNSADPKEIAARQQQLAQKVQEMRRSAQRGEVFTPAASRDFAALVKSALSGGHAAPAKATLRGGDPLQGFEVRVNQVYPKDLPATTVPPSLLMMLPRLPDEVAYRILGPDLLLVDSTLNVIVDFIPDIVPQSAG